MADSHDAFKSIEHLHSPFGLGEKWFVNTSSISPSAHQSIAHPNDVPPSASATHATSTIIIATHQTTAPLATFPRPSQSTASAARAEILRATANSVSELLLMQTTSSSIATQFEELVNSTTSTTNGASSGGGDINVSMLHWTEVLLAIVLCVLIVITVIGNTLVILAVLTTRRLRTVTNCFVMSLAVADWLVGIFVMPPSVAVYLFGSWPLGWILCDIWISLDVLLCTASILSLCAISIDRYLAVTQPLNYSRRRRSKRLAMLMILVVWVLALAITCPPILGWYEPGRRDLVECRYNQNEGYVVFSAMGSFFIPMAVMIYVYVRISCVVASRHDHMTEIEVHKKQNRNFDVEVEAELEMEPSSEQESQSPYRKRGGAATNAASSSSAHSTPLNQHITNAITSTTIIATEPIIAHHPPARNGQYELVNTTVAQHRQPSVRRNKPTATICSSTTPTVSALKSSSARPTHSPKTTTMHCSVRVPHHTPSATSSTAGTGTPYEQKQIRAHHKSLSNRISSLKRENKTTQTLSIVVGGFIVCWLPFFVCYLITPFLPQHSVSGELAGGLTWLGWFNSAMNPFIYAFYSVDFRAAFWRLTFRRFFKNSVRAPYSSNAMSIRR